LAVLVEWPNARPPATARRYILSPGIETIRLPIVYRADQEAGIGWSDLIASPRARYRTYVRTENRTPQGEVIFCAAESLRQSAA
jgi:hypothetical protein